MVAAENFSSTYTPMAKGISAKCVPFDILSTSPWMGVAIIVRVWPTKNCIAIGPTLFAGLSKYVDLKLVNRQEFGSGAVAMRYEPK